MSKNLKGMRKLSSGEIDAMNQIAEAGNSLGDLIDKIELFEDVNCQNHWMEIGRTHLQIGIMAIKRAIGKPENF